MSDSEDSTVTYTAVSSPFEGLSDIGSPGVDGPPTMPKDPYAYVVDAFQAPPSPNYVPGLEELEQAPPLSEFVPEPVYLEVYSVDYPADRDEEEEEPSGYEADDEDEDEDDKEEEEEHPALVDSVSPPPVHRTTARISIPAQAPVPFLSEEEVDRFLAISTPPPSPLTPLSLPLLHIPSPPLPASPPLLVSSPPLPASPTHHLGYRVAMIRVRADTPSISHPLSSSTPPLGTPLLLPIPLHTSSPPLLLPSTNYRAGVFEVTLPPRKRLCITLGLRYEVGKSSYAPTARPSRGFRADYGFVATLDYVIRRNPERDVGYGITDTWDEMLVGMPMAPAADDTKLGRRMTNFVTTVRQDIDEIYGRLDEAQDARAVLSGQLNLLQRDRCSNTYTYLLLKRDARLSCKAWGRSMTTSDAARSEVRAQRTTVLAQQIEIAALRAADRARQAQLVETLRLMSILQTHVVSLQGQQRPAGGPAQTEIPEEAGSSS
ncbi:hypothetical protein Tco_0175069 [Tanacetum coccineum]